ncbi:MAG: signal peptidase II [Rhodothermales bacterium]|nr:signal peptidase II [Rhodothermales bacterium]
MRVLWISAFIVLVDQLAKVTVLRTMYRGQSIDLVGDWLKLTFTENPGMAFGITAGPPGMVTIFSIIATFLIILYLVKVRHGYTPYRTSLAFILGGALGNIIDRVFYAVLFGNGPLFQGHVVDFIHVNMWRGYLPDALPLIGGEFVALFPIWNVADMAIVAGVVGILVFQKRFHEGLIAEDAADADEAVPDAPSPVPLNGAPASPWTPPGAPGESVEGSQVKG